MSFKSCSLIGFSEAKVLAECHETNCSSAESVLQILVSSLWFFVTRITKMLIRNGIN